MRFMRPGYEQLREKRHSRTSSISTSPDAVEDGTDDEESCMPLACSTFPTCQLCAKTIRETQVTRVVYVFKWVLPAVIFAICFFYQCCCLHVGTYYYVQWMGRLERNSRQNVTESTFTGENLSTSFGEGSLYDLAANAIGAEFDVPMKFLDLISICLPICWFFAVIYKVDLQLWTKCCLCGAFLAVGKGTCAVLTVVPDSIGWEGCKKRLGEDGVAWFRDPANVNFESTTFVSLGNLLMMEIWGLNGKHVRYCADMVYSGHTYFVSLFALGCYDCIRKHAFDAQRRNEFEKIVTCGMSKRTVILGFVGLVLSSIVSLDVVLILLNRFHYSLDVFLALLLVYLFYTGVPLSRLATWWAIEVGVPKWRHKKALEIASTEGDGELVLPFCVPCCMFGSGQYLMVKDSASQGMYDTMLLKHLHNDVDLYIQVLQKALDACSDEQNERRFSILGHVDINEGNAYSRKLSAAVNELTKNNQQVTWDNVDQIVYDGLHLRRDDSGQGEE